MEVDRPSTYLGQEFVDVDGRLPQYTNLVLAHGRDGWEIGRSSYKSNWRMVSTQETSAQMLKLKAQT